MSITHWLVQVAKGAGFSYADELNIERGEPLLEVWNTVCAVCQVGDEEIVRAIAERLQLNVADVGKVESRALRLVPEKLARRLQVFPLREDDRSLVVATSDPMNLQLEDPTPYASWRKWVRKLSQLQKRVQPRSSSWAT
jgi:hypothetical protein